MPEASSIQSRSIEDGLPPSQRRWAMISIAVSLGMAVMDSNIVNVALPTIADNLGISAAESVWVVNAYLLAVAVTLLPLASLGDIIGYRRIYRTGLVAFTLASLVCTFSDSLLTLTIARFFQGLGAAGIMSVNAAQVRLLYPSRLLGRGIGVTAMVVALSSGIGPTVAAGVLAFGTWPWLFALNIPLGVLALLLTARNLPAMPGSGGRFDTISAVLNALGIGLLVMAIDSIAHRMNPALAIAGVALAVLVIWRLVRRQLSRSAPLLPVDLLRIRQFRLAISAKTLSFTGQMAAFIALPFLLHDVLGYSAVETGLLMTPWPAAIMVVAPLSGWLADHYPSALICGIGLAIKTVGLVLLAWTSQTMPLPAVLACMALCGLGFGLFQSPNNHAIIGAVPVHRSGGAGGMQGTARLLGQTLGAALTALVFGLASDGITPALIMAAAFDAVAMTLCCYRFLR